MAIRSLRRNCEDPARRRRDRSSRPRKTRLGAESLERRDLLAADVLISEINYNPYDPLPQFGDLAVDSDFYEFIELTNFGDTAADLTGFQLSQVLVDGNLEGVDFSFSAGTMLPPGEQIVVVGDTTAFEARYGMGLNVAGQWTGGRLGNNGELVTLFDTLGPEIIQVEYNDGGGWPGRADGDGSSLELEYVPFVDITDSDNWQSSTRYGGTPGAALVPRNHDVLINEILAHTDPPSKDVVELVNNTGAGIDIGRWYLSDSTDYFKYQIPSNTTLSANGYVTYNEDNFNPSGTSMLPGEFSFSSFGDEAWLLSADNSTGKPIDFRDHVEFEATKNAFTIGRIPDGDIDDDLIPLLVPSLGCDNRAHAIGEVIITEINYDPGTEAMPSDSGLEYVEIYNTTGATIDISGWKVNGATFAAGTMLAAGEAAAVVDFDPTLPANAVLVTAFRQEYGIGPSVQLLGNAGSLSNNGEQVSLRKPNDELQPGSTDIDFVLVDQVTYDDVVPWPLVEDNGLSLQLRTPAVIGNQPEHFEGLAASPGTVSFPGAVAGDLTGDGVVGAADIDVMFEAVQSGTQVLFYDLDGSGTVNTMDTNHLVETILGTSYGDADLSGGVNASGDGGIMLSNLGGGSCHGWAGGDFTGDRMVTASGDGALLLNGLAGDTAAAAASRAATASSPAAVVTSTAAGAVAAVDAALLAGPMGVETTRWETEAAAQVAETVVADADVEAAADTALLAVLAETAGGNADAGGAEAAGEAEDVASTLEAALADDLAG